MFLFLFVPDHSVAANASEAVDGDAEEEDNHNNNQANPMLGFSFNPFFDKMRMDERSEGMEERRSDALLAENMAMANVKGNNNDYEVVIPQVGGHWSRLE